MRGESTEAARAKQQATGRAIALARRCPRCCRKYALTISRDADGHERRACRWPACGYLSLGVPHPDRATLLEAVALAAGTLVDELATQERTSVATWDTLRRAVAALRGTQEG